MALLTRLAGGGLAVAVAAGLLVCPAAAQTPGPSPTLEDEIKAAYLYNFTKFVEWPALAFPKTPSPFVICVAADASFERAVDRIVTGEKIGDRALRLVHVDGDDVAGCHVLFVGRSQQERAPRLLAAIGTAPVLTVSDAPRFLQQGGMILFVLENNRVRFDINVRAADRAGVRVSSKLLRVARRVEPGGTPR